MLFFEDPRLTYTGERIPTVRIALSTNPLVQEYVRVGNQFDKEFIKQYGTRFLGNVTPKGRLAKLYRRKQDLQPKLYCVGQGILR